VVKAGQPSLGGVGTLRRLDTSIAAPEKFLGPVGNMALTAYVGLVDGAQLREGDVVWISAAAGAVGSLAAQIAKLRGHTVIGSAGSPDKVRYLLDELGLDAAFDYHDGPLVDQLRKAAPDGIDVYFDNVGGDHLQAALTVLRPWGRVAMCGALSEYESPEPQPGPTNLFQIVANNLTVRGFRASAYLHRQPEATQQLGAWLKEGRLVYKETIVDGLDRAPEALMRMLSGDTVGKTLVRVAP
jgi:NADPH-dependent curcumin reductase CurA